MNEADKTECPILYVGKSQLENSKRNSWLPYLRQNLIDLGISVEYHSQQRSLVKKLKTTPYRGIIIDGSSVYPSGPLVSKVRQRLPQIPILVARAFWFHSDIKDAFAAGASDILEMRWNKIDPELIQRLREAGMLESGST